MPLPTPPLPSIKTMATPLRLMPDELMTAPLEKAVNLVFRQSIEEGEFDFMENRWVKIHVTDAELDFHIGFDGKQLKAAKHRPCDVAFCGNSSAFKTLALRREDPDTLFFQRRLMIEGDTELGLGLKNLLDSIDTEQLPKLFQTLMKVGNKIEDLNHKA
ncbi:ubiquinone anaerobic biosynthesis accessory factor UbiT [Endozoicomonas montiporae]|uniref:Ubiquinone biosynthesis accessory factor UbiT n=1 Tax=Endozoicomonas montiporae CL-33 TaxID=570277 RepID=A0A142BEU7_9GAMM|nr:SCP2 sterol-binding domain-containing protein [Endozoicomonas montiporae]AMO57273.1 putative SCP-2 family sterol-binding protein [Endozoicomonas montiporae CL-33]